MADFSQSGGIDPTIPLQAGKGVQQTNPLESIGRFANAANSLNSLRLFPGQLQLQQQQVESNATSLAQQHYRAAAQLLTPLLAKDKITADDVATVLGSGEKLGIITQPFLAHLTGTGPAPNTPEYTQFIKSAVAPLSQSSGETAVGQVTRHPGPTFDTGQELIPTTVAPAGLPNPGVPMPTGQSIPTYPSRSQLIGQVQWQDSQGRTHYGTQAEYATARGLDAMIGPATPAQTPPPVTTNTTPQNGPRYAVPGVAPNAATQPDMVGPPMGREASANVAAAENTKQAIGLQSAASNVPAQKGLLGNLDAELDKITTGPGADWRNFAKAFVNTNSPFGNIFNPSTIASQEEFSKQAFQLAQQQFQTLGGTGTDAKLDSTMHTSPSAMLTNYGNKGIIALLKGNADAIAAMNHAWQTQWLPAHGNDTGTYGQFVTQFNQGFDPRIFQSAYMTPAQRADILKGMTDAEKTAFRMKYNSAVARGDIPDPRAAAPQ
jgi:hypothetical protein